MADNSSKGDIVITNLKNKALRGYYNQNVGIDSTEKAKIIASNIKKGVNILGVAGTLETGCKTGTVTGAGSSAVTIETGLSAITVLILVKNKVSTTATGMVALWYKGGTTTGIGVNANSSPSAPSISVGTSKVTGGTFTYTPSGNITGLVTGGSYTWYAF